MNVLMGNLVDPEKAEVDISATKDEHYWKISVRHPPDELINKSLITLTSTEESIERWLNNDGHWRLVNVEAVHRVE